MHPSQDNNCVLLSIDALHGGQHYIPAPLPSLTPFCLRLPARRLPRPAPLLLAMAFLPPPAAAAVRRIGRRGTPPTARRRPPPVWVAAAAPPAPPAAAANSDSDGRGDTPVAAATGHLPSSLTRRTVLAAPAAAAAASSSASSASASSPSPAASATSGAMAQYVGPLSLGYSFAYPTSWSAAKKPIKTHLSEVIVSAPKGSSASVGLVVDGPVKIGSIEEFGAPGVAYIVEYVVDSSRGIKHYVAKATVAANQLYVMTATCKEDEYEAARDGLAAVLASLRVAPKV